MITVVLDAGALAALERRDPRLLALADELYRARAVGHVPAGVIAQVWRGSPRQHAVGRLLSSGAARIDPMTEELGYRLGVLLGRTHTSDVIDGHVAFLARRLQASVLTSDPDDLAALDPSLRLVPI